MNFHISSRTLRLVLLAVMAVGLLTVAFGVYTMLDANSKIDALTATIQSTARITPPSDSEIPAAGVNPLTGPLMALDRDREDQIKRKGQGTSLIGVGAVMLGGAAIILMRVSEQTPQGSTSKHA